MKNLKHLARRIRTIDLRIANFLLLNYSPPLYQLSYRELLQVLVEIIIYL